MKERGKNIWKIAGIAVTAALAMILFYLSAAAWGGLVFTRNHVLFYLEQPLSFGEAKEVIEKNQKIKERSSQGETEEKVLPGFCIWGQKKDVSLTNKNLSRSTQANAVLFCGNPELLFEDCRVPVKEDKQGCLIDEQTAWELFGSSQAAGKELSYEGQSYIIRKVITSKEKVIAFQVSAASESGGEEQETGAQEQTKDNILNRITMYKPQDSSIRELSSLWDYQYGICVRILDMELLRGISGFCVLLFPVTVCIFFWRYLHGTVRKFPAKVIVSLLMLIVLLCLLGSWVKLPADYIPTRWSDFSFWTGLWKEKTEGMKSLLGMPKADLDHKWITWFYQSVGCGLLAEAFLVMTGIAAKHICSISEKYDILLSKNDRKQ